MTRATLAVGLVLAAVVLACTPRPGEAQFTCDPLAPGSCPDGYACQLRVGHPGHRCYRDPGGSCGDGALDEGEACDGDQLRDTCRVLGFFGGRARCTATCEVDASACFTAGSLACGPDHCCAAGTDGATYCWGSGNYWGEATDFRPEAVASDVTLVALTLGSGFSCGLDDTGRAWCWGNGNSGQLGCGNRLSSDAPVLVLGGPFAHLAAGWNHACGLDPDGRAHCWGSNAEGALGSGVAGSGDAVVPMPVDTDLRFVELVAGASFTCGRTGSGEAHCWGGSALGELGDGSPGPRITPGPVAGGLRFEVLGSGMYHACGVTGAGATHCWGWPFGPEPAPVPGEARLVALAGEYSSTCGLDAAGEAWCWGNGPLGIPELASATMVRVPLDRALTELGLGFGFACGLTDDGRVVGWGWNGGGGLGQGERRVSPTRVAFGDPVVSLRAGFANACIRTAAGEAWCWGNNGYRVLLDGTAFLRYRPAAITGISGLGEVQPGGTFSVALDDQARLWGWGYLPPPAEPHPAELIEPDRRWRSVAAGGAHLCGVDDEGVAWCWGANDTGQCGNGSTTLTEGPTRVAGEHDFERLSASWGLTCGVDTSGDGWCWGWNNLFMIFASQPEHVTEPQPIIISSDPRVVDVQPGLWHVCALDDGGQAWCWGMGTLLGDGTSRSHWDPARVIQEVAFTRLTVGEQHACGLDAAGRAWCWGANFAGQVGDGTREPRYAPVRVPFDGVFTAVAAGANHTCALDTEGGVHCWGQNEVGQLASDDYFVTPVEVDPPREAP
jgi:alpha-tubulin suppressor-like RCC1 family protein